MTLAACAPIASDSGFLKSSLTYLDCAGQSVGTTGYAALSQPGSPVAQLVLAIITLFIAWHGVRMMFGRMPDMGDAVIAVAKIGLVLMLMTSWPAVRTVFAAPAFSGPAELVDETKADGSPSLEDRLQRVDDGIVTLTKWGTGRLDIRSGTTLDGKPAASEFGGIALTDSLALGLGRLSFLVSALMSIGVLKLLTGVMISALPLFAGLLLFDVTRSLFFGWVRVLFAMFVASFAVPLIMTVELSLIEPWLAKAIAARSSFLATPAAPTELLAITASFFLIISGSMLLIVKACFSVDVASMVSHVRLPRGDRTAAHVPQLANVPVAATQRTAEPSRAEQLAWTMSRQNSPATIAGSGQSGANWRKANDPNHFQPNAGTAGSVRRRTRQRTALSQSRRNQS